SQDSEHRRWREAVLDVRQHVEFIGRELDEAGVELEIYRSGAGKSGGQRQKLATTCLAAALRYQLGGHERGAPSNLYPRQLPVPGLDSKWLEQRTALVSSLLTALRGEDADAGGQDFYARCG